MEGALTDYVTDSTSHDVRKGATDNDFFLAEFNSVEFGFRMLFLVQIHQIEDRRK
ncbi:unnamed protein product [Amoebophrya sp. A25]|nr:unnamed protein product [Amoebophrya sp. A25]|eukprot:GSA25T00000989001.1